VTSRPRLVCALLVAAALAASAQAADQIVLRDGFVVQGGIEEVSELAVVIRVDGVRRHVPREQVLRIERDAATPAAGATAATAAASATAEPLPVDTALVARVAGGAAVERQKALETLAAGWPATRATLEAVLRHPAAAVRAGAASVLDDARLSGAEAYVPDLVADEAPAVRRTGVRMARRLHLVALEGRISERVARDTDPGVRAEALRALEDFGTTLCLHDVLRAFEFEQDALLRRRCLRVLRRITGEDRKPDDLHGWRDAVRDAVRRAGEAARAK
jgi:hypothetical protein